MNHFTNKKGYNALRAVSPWKFLARKQRGKKPFGAYFTTLDVTDSNFFMRVRIPTSKRKFVFRFVDVSDLRRLPGPRGRFVFYSPKDYLVNSDRQLYAGPT